MKTAVKVSIIVAVALILFGVMISLIAISSVNFDFTMTHGGSSKENSYTIDGGFENIAIDAVEADVRFEPSADGKCRVECVESTNVYHTVKVANGTLVIKRVDERRWYEHIGFFWRNMRITVYLPQTEYDELHVKTVSGDIRIPDIFSFNEAEAYSTSGDIGFAANVKNSFIAKSVSGNLVISGIRTDSFSAHTTSGDVSTDDIRCDRFYIDTTSGDISADDVICGRFNINTTSGSVKMLDVNAEDMYIKSVSGDITMRSCDAEDIELKTTSGDIRGSLLSGKSFQTHTTSGRISVPSSSADGGECRISTVSGDVNIKIE